MPLRTGSLQRQYSHQEPYGRFQYSEQHNIGQIYFKSPDTFELEDDPSFYHVRIVEIYCFDEFKLTLKWMKYLQIQIEH